MRIIRDDNFRLSNWRKAHGRRVYLHIELLAEAVGMQSFEGRLNNKVTFPPRAALKTFYISPRQCDKGNGWTMHKIFWKTNNPTMGNWTSAWGHFKDGVLSHVVTESYGSVYGKEKLIVKSLEVLDADYEVLDVKIIEDN